MAQSMLFVCESCGLSASSPAGWLVVEDTRGGTIYNPTGRRWRLCSWKCLRSWAQVFEPEPDEPGDSNTSAAAPRHLVGEAPRT